MNNNGLMNTQMCIITLHMLPHCNSAYICTFYKAIIYVSTNKTVHLKALQVSIRVIRHMIDYCN